MLSLWGVVLEGFNFGFVVVCCLGFFLKILDRLCALCCFWI